MLEDNEIEFDSQARIPVKLISKTEFLVTIQTINDGVITPFTNFGVELPEGEWFMDLVTKRIR